MAFAIIVVALIAASPMAAQAHADAVYISDHASAKVWDVPGSSTAAGEEIGVWSPNGGDNQVFLLADATDGYVQIETAAGLCVDISGAATHSGARVIQWPCHGGTNQQFQLVRAYAGPSFDYRLVARHSGLAIARDAEDKLVQTATGGVWKLSPLSGPGDPWEWTSVGR